MADSTIGRLLDRTRDSLQWKKQAEAVQHNSCGFCNYVLLGQVLCLFERLYIKDTEAQEGKRPYLQTTQLPGGCGPVDS
jgi:hypothetical protein